MILNVIRVKSDELHREAGGIQGYIQELLTTEELDISSLKSILVQLKIVSSKIGEIYKLAKP